AFVDRLDRVRARLLAARDARKQPHRDDKVIAAWNGLMIAGLADGAAVLKETKYLDAAEAAARFILANMRNAKGDLLRIWRNGTAQTPAFLEDHAMLAFGLTRLARACAALGRDGAAHRDAARDLADRAARLFSDPEHPGALYDTRANQRDLVVRAMSRTDGALPCGQSYMLHALLDLHDLTGDAD